MPTIRRIGVAAGANSVIVEISSGDLIKVKSYSISSSDGGRIEADLYFDDGATVTKRIDRVSTVNTVSITGRNITDAKNRRLVFANDTTSASSADVIIEYEILNTGVEPYHRQDIYGKLKSY